uniref:Uncharacterized protein n=1 Tax=Myoviridae sp. ctBZY1 TaxID=2825046 RepID=A0A8S5V8I5_9CAUD|nr:MAG TPA: hypothetical protein [Myoviridae sp. ctBZY1]
MRFLPDIRQVAPHKCESSILSRQLAPLVGKRQQVCSKWWTPLFAHLWA